MKDSSDKKVNKPKNTSPLAREGVNASNWRTSTSPLAGEEEFQHEAETSARNSGEGYKIAHRNYTNRIKTLTRTLRKNSTPQEKKLWAILQNNQLGFKFRRQFAVDNKYIADFICLEKRLIVELDGGQHNQSFTDTIRTFYLEEQNFKLIRFWNNEITNNINGCVDYIIKELNTPHPVF